MLVTPGGERVSCSYSSNQQRNFTLIPDWDVFQRSEDNFHNLKILNHSILSLPLHVDVTHFLSGD